MPRFQSRLFNLIDRSLPVQLGRRARQWYQKFTFQLGDRVSEELEQLIEQPQRFAKFLLSSSKQATKVLLYPIHALAQQLKRNYPRLGAAKTKVNFLLQPVQSLVLWSDRSDLFHQTEQRNLARLSTRELYLAQADTIHQLQQLSEILSVEEASDESLSNSNTSQTQQRLEKVRQLIKAAIAYFFGKKSGQEQLSTNSNEDENSSNLFVDDNGPWPRVREVNNAGQLNEYKRKEFADLAVQSNSSQALTNPKSKPKDLVEQSHPSKNLINLGSSSTRAIKLKTKQSKQSLQSQKQQSNPVSRENSYSQKLERIKKLIQAAIAYFFGKKISVKKLEGTTDDPWLSMADLFGDEGEPTPIIGDREVAYIAQLSSYSQAEFSNLVKVTESSRELATQNVETSTITQLVKPSHQIARNHSVASSKAITLASETSTSEIIAESEAWLAENSEPPQPLKAWIDIPATFLGYVYSPVMQFIHWLDEIVAHIERWIFNSCQKFWDWLKNLLRIS